MSYNYVNNSDSQRCRSACSEILTEARDTLREQYDIVTNFELVGSGARNTITRNGDGPYDLDYNLVIVHLPDQYKNNLGNLKETVRRCLNNAVRSNDFDDAQDSTSVLTSIRHFNDTPNVVFSFDVAIVMYNSNGTLMRLIHNKNAVGFGYNGQLTWNEVPSAKKVADKVAAIKKAGAGYWMQVRDKYLDFKNRYLSRQDNSHPSFIVYVEAVNDVYQTIQNQGEKKTMTKGSEQKVSGKTHTQAQLNAYANQNNPNNPAYRASHSNHANQCNPNNKEFSHSRSAGSKKK